MTSSPRFTSLAESRSSTASAGSLEHATWERATMLAVRSRPLQQLPCRLPERRYSRLGRGRWHSTGRRWLFCPLPRRTQRRISWAGWAEEVAPAPLLSCRVSLLRLRSPFSFCSINGCVYNGRRGRKMRRGGGVCDVVWGASLPTNQVRQR